MRTDSNKVFDFENGSREYYQAALSLPRLFEKGLAGLKRGQSGSYYIALMAVRDVRALPLGLKVSLGKWVLT